MRTFFLSLVVCLIIITAQPRTAKAEILPQHSLEYECFAAVAIIYAKWSAGGDCEVLKSYYGPFREGNRINVARRIRFVPEKETTEVPYGSAADIEPVTVESDEFVLFLGIEHESWVPANFNSSVMRIQDRVVYRYQQYRRGHYELIFDEGHPYLSNLEDAIEKYTTASGEFRRTYEGHGTYFDTRTLKKYLERSNLSRDTFYLIMRQLKKSGAEAIPTLKELISGEKDGERMSWLIQSLADCSLKPLEIEEFLLELLLENRKALPKVPANQDTLDEENQQLARVRVSILGALSKTCSRNALPVMREEITNGLGGYPWVIRPAAQVLGKYPDEANLEILERAYVCLIDSKESKEVRSVIISAIALNRFAGSVKLLIKCLDDPREGNVALTCKELRAATGMDETEWTAGDWKKWWDAHKDEYETKDNEGD